MATKLDKEHYLGIARTEGFNAALTALHHDIEALEQETFEGSKGYQPALWDKMFEWRDFSRELWELQLQENTKAGAISPLLKS